MFCKFAAIRVIRIIHIFDSVHLNTKNSEWPTPLSSASHFYRYTTIWPLSSEKKTIINTIIRRVWKWVHHAKLHLNYLLSEVLDCPRDYLFRTKQGHHCQSFRVGGKTLNKIVSKQMRSFLFFLWITLFCGHYLWLSYLFLLLSLMSLLQQRQRWSGKGEGRWLPLKD